MNENGKVEIDVQKNISIDFRATKNIFFTVCYLISIKQSENVSPAAGRGSLFLFMNSLSSRFLAFATFIHKLDI